MFEYNTIQYDLLGFRSDAAGTVWLFADLTWYSAGEYILVSDEALGWAEKFRSTF